MDTPHILMTGQEYDPLPEEIRRLADLAEADQCALCAEPFDEERRLLGVQYIDCDPTLDDAGLVLKIRIQPAYVCYQCWLYAIDNPLKVASQLDARP